MMSFHHLCKVCLSKTPPVVRLFGRQGGSGRGKLAGRLSRHIGKGHRGRHNGRCVKLEKTEMTNLLP